MLGSTAMVTDEATCLSLNVWTPAADSARRPVMVWIHGGAFLTGSGSTPWYDGSRLAAQEDVVVVTINYRLGAFGFLFLDDTGSDLGESSANVGILDQVAALQWVADNIAAFGGDPGNVTIFGESAGAMSVGTLLALPAARGLFQRAILQSGACHNSLGRDEATKLASELLGAIGISATDLAAVQEVPAAVILEAQARLSASYFSQGMPFQPVHDGDVLPDTPIRILQGGGADGVDVLIGTNLDEWKLFSALDPRMADLDDARLSAAVESGMPGVDADSLIAAYRQGRGGSTPGDLLGALTTDRIFRVPAIRVAEARAAAGQPAYMYLFTWASPAFGGRLGSCHALEIPFAFDNLHQPGVSMFCGSEPPQEVATGMRRAWASFARTGAPIAEPSWPAYDLGSRSTMVIDTEWRTESDPRGEERQAWEDLI
jgi:para-nitrobenzyl esterase